MVYWIFHILANMVCKFSSLDEGSSLATVKGIIEVNSFKVQQELGKLWREIDTLIE